jgi:hypothetical protein
MDAIGLIVIIFVVVTIVSALSAAKKKPAGKDGESQAPRRPAMSDIQRAFMMMSGQDSEENEHKRETIVSNFKVPQPPVAEASKSGSLTSRVGLGDYEGLSDSEGLGGYEGLSNYGSAPQGTLWGEVPVVSTPGAYKYVAAAETVSYDEASTLKELKGSSSLERRGDMKHRLDESVEIADIAETNRDMMLAAKNRPQPTLRLFENKNDVVKAIIFSEVLTKRSPAGRRAAKR